MAIWGADIAQLKTLGTKLQAGASEIDKQKSMLTKILEGTDWKGPDAERYEHAGLVTRNQHGPWAYYAMVPAAFADLSEILRLGLAASSRP